MKFFARPDDQFLRDGEQAELGLLPFETPGGAPLLPRRAGRELPIDDGQRQQIRPPQQPVGSGPPQMMRRLLDGNLSPPDDWSRRVVPLPQAVVPNIAPLVVSRDREEASADGPARRAALVPVIPAAGLAALARRATQEAVAEEAATRAKLVSAPVAPVASAPPLSVRRATEETIFEVAWRRVRSFLGLSATFVKATPGRSSSSRARRRSSFGRPRRRKG